MSMAESPRFDPSDKTPESLQTVELKLSPQEQFAFDLVGKITEAVIPQFGIKQKDVPVSTRSHDFNYALDEAAEGAIKEMFESDWKEAEKNKWPKSAFITEDQGFVDPGGELGYIYMIDPVDGSRPAMSGTEQACVTMVAVKGDKREATFDDIEFGVTHFIKEGITLFVRKYDGVWKKNSDGSIERLEPRENPPINLKDCSVTTESYSFNKAFMGAVYDPLVRSVGYEMSAPSGSWSVASLIRGHNEIAVDARNYAREKNRFDTRLIYDLDKSKGAYPMDIAASVLMVEELGGKVTDAGGEDLSKRRLWDFDKKGNWNAGNQLSIVAAITPDLHDQAVVKIREGIKYLNTLK